MPFSSQDALNVILWIPWYSAILVIVLVLVFNTIVLDEPTLLDPRRLQDDTLNT